MDTATLGNLDLVSSNEDLIVNYLKKNIDLVNKSSKDVNAAKGIYPDFIKRILDLIISIPAFTLFLPINLIIGICTFFDVGRPIFYKQTRIGKDLKPFTIVKFRNMNEKKDADGKLLPPSQRVTKFGKIMRKLSLDELLNFWSVIKGDMSIIGPRPLPATFTERMSERHKKRTAVRPGLECPRYLQNNPDWSNYQNQFENDIWYVENVSFKTDLLLLFLLFKMTFNFKKRAKNAEGRSYFVGYDDDCTATSFTRFIRLHPETWSEILSENGRS